MTPELLAEVREHRAALLDILRAGRVAEVRAFYGQAFGRLSGLCPGTPLGTLWLIISCEHPPLAASIERAEYAADGAALAFQRGDDVDSSAFLAYLQGWEAAWVEAIEALASNVCSDCGKRAVVLATTDYGCRYCRTCLRPEPLAAKPKTKGCDA
jgi:hypothetical protein